MYEVEKFLGEVTFLAIACGVDYGLSLHSRNGLICELHEHLSSEYCVPCVIRLPMFFFFFLIHYPMQVHREPVKVSSLERLGSLERRADCSRERSVINISIYVLPKITQLPIVRRRQSCTLCESPSVVFRGSVCYAKGLCARSCREPHCDDLVGKHAEQLAFFPS